MFMIGNEESNNQIRITNVDSIICDKNQEFKFTSFAKECFKLCSYEDMQTGVKVGLEHNKR